MPKLISVLPLMLGAFTASIATADSLPFSYEHFDPVDSPFCTQETGSSSAPLKASSVCNEVRTFTDFQLAINGLVESHADYVSLGQHVNYFLTASGSGPFLYGSTIQNFVRAHDTVTISGDTGTGTLRVTSLVEGTHSFVDPTDISLTLGLGIGGCQFLGNMYSDQEHQSGFSPFICDLPFTFGAPMDLSTYLSLRVVIYTHDQAGTFGADLDFLHTASFSYEVLNASGQSLSDATMTSDAFNYPLVGTVPEPNSAALLFAVGCLIFFSLARRGTKLIP